MTAISALTLAPKLADEIGKQKDSMVYATEHDVIRRYQERIQALETLQSWLKTDDVDADIFPESTETKASGSGGY